MVRLTIALALAAVLIIAGGIGWVRRVPRSIAAEIFGRCDCCHRWLGLALEHHQRVAHKSAQSL